LPDLPRLTVAVPTYNGARHLAEALGGILRQENAAFELLVCDDQSEDATAQIVRDFAGDRARFIRNSERFGLAGNWNRCVEMSRTEWVAIFHQDDVMLPGHLQKHLAAIDAATDARLGLVASAACVIDDEGRPVSTDVVDQGGLVVPSNDGATPCGSLFSAPKFASFLADHNPLRCSAVTTRRSAHAEVGGFDASFRYVVDWEFWRRVALRWSVSWIGGSPSVAVRWHLASETHRFKSGTADLEETARLLDVIFSDPDQPLTNPRAARLDADRRLSRAYLNRAYEAARGGRGGLTRSCLRTAVRLWPGIVGRIARDPRLLARLLVAVARR
jgi:glycosyltransferase involved in cell wall biosynthesis